MPMLMRLQRLLEARPFQRRFAPPLAQQARPAQHPPDARRADGHDVGVEHHERQPPVALQRMLAIKVEDGLLFPLLEPEIPGNPSVVLVDAAVAPAPGIELAGRDAEPGDETPGGDLGLLGPAPHEIDDLVAHVGRRPGVG